MPCAVSLRYRCICVNKACMTAYSLGTIASVTGGRLKGDGSLPVKHILIDSRNIVNAEGSLFFALKGRNHDGHNYVTELYGQGVRAFAVSDPDDLHSLCPDAGFVIVDNTLRALQELARHHRRRFRCPLIAITGSNGKTIIKEWLHYCLEGNKHITRSPKSYNSQVGVPLSLWLMDESTELGIFEAGISMPGEMKHLQHMIMPDIGIMTNIGEAHQENFQNMEQKIGEKLKLFYGCRSLVFCQDHQAIRNAIEHTPELAGVHLFRWSVTSKADLQVTGLVRKKTGTLIRVICDHKTVEVTIPFTDQASVENALHCLSLLLLLKTDPDLIRERMATLPVVAMRLEQKSAINGCTIINDTYNSDINSLAIALDMLNRQVQHKRKVLILSDILQSGKKQAELYMTVASMAEEKKVDRIIGIGEALKEYRHVFSIPGTFFSSTDEFLQRFKAADFMDEAILLKGSRQFEFEKIAARLEQKQHITRLEINLSALTHNLNHFRSLLHPGTKMLVMVKALSYGSGASEIANLLQYQRVDYLGVAFADEGVSLRQAGISLPVIVMNPDPEYFDTIIQYRLEPEIYNVRGLKMFNEAVVRNQEVEYPVHIKIDTGMHRMGFAESQIGDLLAGLNSSRNIRVKSVFSHLAASDEHAFDDFTRAQISLFDSLTVRLADGLGYTFIRHILNSSGIERFPEAQFDMVRLGIGLYGISSLASSRLRNVSTLKTAISQIKSLAAGETVGYGRKGKLTRDSLIAAIPIGYADGLNRRLGNGKASFLVKGKMAPVIGNICMDTTMIDVTGMDVREGDEVVIFGDDCPVSRLAEKMGTIPYEVFTSVSGRVKRVYYHD